MLNYREKKDGMFAYWPFDESSGFKAVDAVTGREDDISFALRKERYQDPVEPLRGRGVQGSCLFFDGYSTFIRREAAEMNQPSAALTISVWIAPRSFGRSDEGRRSAIVNHHHQERGEGYFLGLERDGSIVFGIGSQGSWHELSSRTQRALLNEWTFIAASYDAAAGEMKVYVNGSEAASERLDEAHGIAACFDDFLIGRHNDGVVLAEAFILNGYDGCMDELALYERELGGEEIRRRYENDLANNGGTLPQPLPDLDIELRKQRMHDRHRPQFHLSPPGHWMNEPHAPIYFNGQYHLFYQSNPQGPFWNHIHWGHWVSEDMIRWRDLPPALAPGQGFDRDGIWSGSACLDASGNPVLFYTSGDFETFPTQAVGIAHSVFSADGDNDLIHWEKHPAPVVEQGKDEGLYGEFRDPFVWEEDGTWYMLVGTGTGKDEENRGGTASVYTSTGNFTDWTYRGPLFVSDYEKHPYLGVMWELPVLLPLPLKYEQDYSPSGKHILLICPWGEGAKVEVNYWIGEWNKASCRFVPDHEEPGLIDVGDFHFTGPSGMVDPRTGRTNLFTIAQGERTPQIDYDCGWSHSGGIPVSLWLREDGRLGVEPIGELEQLRAEKLLEATGNSAYLNERLAAIQGDMLEIRVNVKHASAIRYGFSLRRSPQGEEETILFYDRMKGHLSVNREKATLDPDEAIGGVQGGAIDIGEETLRLVIYVDRSLIECYANGVGSLTTRTYPSRQDALGLQMWSEEGSIEDATVEIWSMSPAFLIGNQNGKGELGV